MNTSSLSETLSHELADELTQALGRIKHCLDQLTDAQVWQRPAEKMNSIGNLLLHLAGNVRQWIVSGVGGARDNRRRQAEFDERGPISRTDLWNKLQATIAEAIAALAKPDADEWQRVRRIQGFEVTGLGAAVHSVAHFRGHTQEIIHQTRTLLGDSYRFAFVPTTKEQGACP
jgi:uncharacterized damage-inducible protein DinB